MDSHVSSSFSSDIDRYLIIYAVESVSGTDAGTLRISLYYLRGGSRSNGWPCLLHNVRMMMMGKHKNPSTQPWDCHELDYQADSHVQWRCVPCYHQIYFLDISSWKWRLATEIDTVRDQWNAELRARSASIVETKDDRFFLWCQSKIEP